MRSPQVPELEQFENLEDLFRYLEKNHIKYEIWAEGPSPAIAGYKRISLKVDNIVVDIDYDDNGKIVLLSVWELEPETS